MQSINWFGNANISSDEIIRCPFLPHQILMDMNCIKCNYCHAMIRHLLSALPAYSRHSIVLNALIVVECASISCRDFQTNSTNKFQFNLMFALPQYNYFQRKNVQFLPQHCSCISIRASTIAFVILIKYKKKKTLWFVSSFCSANYELLL